MIRRSDAFDGKRKRSDDPAYGKNAKTPTYAKTLVLEATGAVNDQNITTDLKGLTTA